MSDVNENFQALPSAEPCAADVLLPLVYEELRKLAVSRMAGQSGHTLQPTALVHEAWLRLVRSEKHNFDNRGHFFAAAAEAMRCILIDHARRKSTRKRGGGLHRIELEQVDLPDHASEETLLLVDEALQRLTQEDPKIAELVKLRFFGGLKVEEAAVALGVTDRTARRYWRFARAWLFHALTNGPAD